MLFTGCCHTSSFEYRSPRTNESLTSVTLRLDLPGVVYGHFVLRVARVSPALEERIVEERIVVERIVVERIVVERIVEEHIVEERIAIGSRPCSAN